MTQSDYTEMFQTMDEIKDELTQRGKKDPGDVSKAAHRRARVKTSALEKLFKQFRKESPR